MNSTDLYKNASDYDPYSEQIGDTKKTFWDSAAELFGFKSNYQQRIEDLQMQSKLRTDQMNMLADEAAYNSEAEKAARMRAAGLNPDLQGLGEASQAGEYNEPQTTPMAGDYWKTNAENFSTAIQMGLSLATGFANVQGLLIDNATKRVVNTGEWSNLIDKYMPDLIEEPTMQVIDSRTGRPMDLKGGGYYMQWTDNWKDEIPEEDREFARPVFNEPQLKKEIWNEAPAIQFLNKKDQKKFKAAVKQRFESMKGQAKNWEDFYTRARAHGMTARELGRPENNGQDLGELSQVFGAIGNVMLKTEKIRAEFEKVLAENNYTYEQLFDPELAAQNDNQANAAAQAYQQFITQTNAAWNETLKEIGTWKNDTAKCIGTLMVSWLRSQTPLPSINLSRRQTTNYNSINAQNNIQNQNTPE